MAYVLDTPRTAEVLRKALESLGPNGEKWMQGGYSDGIRMCASAAVGKSATLAYQALVEELPPSCCGWVSGWNDEGGRTFADVKALFEKAIAKAEKSDA